VQLLVFKLTCLLGGFALFEEVDFMLKSQLH